MEHFSFIINVKRYFLFGFVGHAGRVHHAIQRRAFARCGCITSIFYIFFENHIKYIG